MLRFKNLDESIGRKLIVISSYMISYFIVFFSLSISINIENNFKNSVFLYVILGTLLFFSSLQFFKQISFLQLGLSGVIYFLLLAGLYFAKMTLNLNNEEFDWTKFHGFWDTNFIPCFLILLLLIFVFKIMDSKKLLNIKFFNFEYKKISKFYVHILSQFATMFIVTSNQFVQSFLSNKLFAVSDIKKVPYAGQLFWYSLGMYLFFSLITYSAVKGIAYLCENKPTPALALSTSFLLAFVFNYSIQAGITDQGSWYGYYTASGATIFQIVFIAICFLFIYILINRYLLATVINVIIGVLISYVNMVKFSTRNEPLLLSDLNWIGDIVFFKDYVDDNTLLVTLTLTAWVIFALYYFRKSCLPGKIYKNLKLRLMLIATIVLSFVTVLTVFSNEEDGRIPNKIPVLSAVYNLYDVNWLGTSANARFQSLSFVWLKQMTITDIEKPSKYSQKEIDNLYKKYKSLAKEINTTRTENISNQTVIFILSESLADPERVPGVTLSAPVLPQIKQIQSETTSGLMKSDGYGGGTANMEFQTLTGLPMYNFNDMISVLYTEVIPDMTYIPSISNAFDPQNRIVIHLSDATHYARNSVYTKLKFNEFIATSGSDNIAEEANLLGAYPSDSSTYDNILAKIDSSQNQFFSVMTMQNHGPWIPTDLSDITASSDRLSAEENENLTNYARLLSYTDSSTAEFLQQLQGIDKKITVVFYGDHLPGIYPKTAFKDSPESQYLTDYFIWSNHDTVKDDYPLVNSSDFPAELLAHTNSRVSPYYALLTEVLNKASVDKSKLDSDGKKVAKDLKMIQYDLTEGKGYILKYSDFFEFE
ncbi:sulfatase-like hydrolase/transferase [Streptococcus ruminicola]|uniref:LTA synthase family protein n=1 Tax=Streptococcus ruminicola TaxID=2686210 RepID=UPI003F6011DF